MNCSQERDQFNVVATYDRITPSWAAAPSLEPLPVLLGRVRALLSAQKFQQAEDILRGGVFQYPHDLETSASYAVAAAGRENWHEAAARWKETLARFPSARSFHGAAATAYAKAGFVALADALLEQCFAEDEGSNELRTVYALLAHQTERWALAAERWGRLMQLDLANSMYRQLRSEALWQADLARSEDVFSPNPAAEQTARPRIAHAPGEYRATERETTASLVARFESLGDNCEFGLVQRHCGAEPATLYRFSAIEPERMVELLDLGLAPLGDPEHTIVEISGKEYMARDRRGYFLMHTFVPVSQSDAATVLKRQRARIAVLTRKMLFQLKRADRMFIVKDSTAEISDDTLRRVLASLRRYGPNRLLGMRHANADHPPGSVQRLDRDLLVGYVKTMFGCGEEITDYSSWLEVLRRASTAELPRHPRAATDQGAIS